jgi:hypothetical protein
LDDSEALTVGLAASCSNGKQVIELLADRQTAKELCALKATDIGMTFAEFSALFSNFRPVRTDAIVPVLGDGAFKRFVASVQQQLACTIEERDQKQAWSQAVVRVLVYVAMHSEFETEERVGCAMGGVVRADLRRLEDLRAAHEGDAMDVLSVGSSIAALVKCLYV